MKSIFDHHVREIHITEDRQLRLRVANINQAIEALGLTKQGLDQAGHKRPEIELYLSPQQSGMESRNCEKVISSITISFVEKQKATHRDVYIIRVFPNIRDNTTVIINEDNVEAVRVRLIKLIGRFEQECKKSSVHDQLSPSNDIQMVGCVQRVTPVVEVHTLTVGGGS